MANKAAEFTTRHRDDYEAEHLDQARRTQSWPTPT